MIVTRLMGGLGNQMFQYAAGRRLAELHGVELELDLSYLQDRTPRPEFTYRDYALGVFAHQAEIAASGETWLYRPIRPTRLTRPVQKLLRNMRGYAWIEEVEGQFCEAALTAPPNSYLVGFWQSEQYFAEAADVIRAEFQFREPMDAPNREMAAQIQTVNAVSLHVRRGDYVQHASAAQTYHPCDLDYYRSAVAAVCERVEEPHFFLFSDEPDWVRANLDLRHPSVTVDFNTGVRSSQDMRLMSLCRHHIIANSSFSWWGAWLDPRPEKIVVAPRRWFRDPARELDGMIPAGWLRV